MKIIEEKLYVKGCSKIGLLIQQENLGGIDFYRKAGYIAKNITYMEKQLK